MAVNPVGVRSVVNFSLPTDVCDLHFIPEPFPALPDCFVQACTPAPGWSCNLDAGGGASWFANSPADCISPGNIKGPFSFVLDPGFCCYVVQFTGQLGEVLLEQEECFTLCGKVKVEDGTWGKIKKFYER